MRPGASMKRQGGDFSKVGNWYEEACVVLQFLRILCGEAVSLTWEPRGASNAGTDFILIEPEKTILVQCKTRSERAWAPGDMAIVLGKVATRLRNDGFFRFVTDSKPYGLYAAVQDAKTDISDTDWFSASKDRATYLSGLGFDPAIESHLPPARQAMQRIQVRMVGKEELAERSRELAVRLLPSDPENLVARLKALAEPESLAKAWTSARLRASLGLNIQWLSPADRSMESDWLAEQNANFLGKITALQGRNVYERQEVDQVVSVFQSDDLPGVVLVHGAAGSGKSHVLAQVSTRLAELGIACLGIRADAWRDHGDDLIARFRAKIGDGRGCIIIDQLDQVAATPAQSQAGIKRIEAWIRAAVFSGLVVVVGCRSVDAIHDTQIHRVLENLSRKTIRIEVGDLPEGIVVEQLARIQTPLSELPIELARLARNPMMLALVVDILRRKGPWLGASSTHELVDRWCEEVASSYGEDSIALIDLIVGRMETDGVIAVDPIALPPNFRSTVKRLVDAGILIREGERIRLFHQVIADTRSAVRLGISASASEVISRLGTRERQSFIESRRLRLAVPRLVQRDEVGAKILRDLGESEQLRPLLRRAVLLGLADVRNPSASVRRLVQAWLETPARRVPVLQTVVVGQPYWTDALREWIDATWSSTPDFRAHLLDCCASVSTRRGDVVANHLKRWERENPGTIGRAQMIFWHNVSEDSDELFEQRLAYLATTRERDYFANWKDLIISHSLRSIRLLRTKLECTELDKLLDHTPVDWLHSWPSDPNFIRSGQFGEAWEQLRPWWINLPNIEIYKVGVAVHNLPPCSLWDLVQFLATAVAACIESNRVSWSQLIALLPNPIRDLDGWFLLTLGSKADFSGATISSATDATDWFMADTKWASLRIGLGDGPRYSLAVDFLGNLAPHLDREAYDRLEKWLVQFRDEWTVGDEQHRYAFGEKTGRMWPNDLGKTAFALLPALGSARWSAEARAYYQYVTEKFRGFSVLEGHASMFGWVGPKVGDDVAQKWTAQQWAKQIFDAPLVDNRHRQMGNDRIGEHTKDNLSILLGRCAGREPGRYAEIGLFLAEHPKGVPERAFSLLLDGIGQTKRPDHVKPGATWEEAPSQKIIAFACHPRVLNEPDCARELSRLIEVRPDLDWPETALGRLIAIALGNGQVFSVSEMKKDRRSRELTSFRINQAPCMALHALSQVAKRRAGLQPQFLGVAREVILHHDVGRRASAAVLAAHCFDASPEICARLVINACEDVNIACEDDVNHTLRYCCTAESLSAEVHALAVSVVIGLTRHGADDYVSEYAAFDVLVLRAWEIIDQAKLVEIMEENLLLRRHAARILARWIKGSEVEGWMRTTAIVLANDEDPHVGDAILWCLRNKGPSRLLSDREFSRAIISSKAAARNQEHLLHAFDEEGALLPVSDLVLKAGQLVVEGLSERTQPWKRAHEITQVNGLLYRLYEEAVRSAEWEIARLVLDCFDQMVEQDVYRAKELLAIMSKE